MQYLGHTYAENVLIGGPVRQASGRPVFDLESESWVTFLVLCTGNVWSCWQTTARSATPGVSCRAGEGAPHASRY
jgi:hypothetical protein